MASHPRVLLLIPDPSEAESFEGMLRVAGVPEGDVARAGTLAEAQAAAAASAFDVAVLDLAVPDAPGLLGVAMLLELPHVPALVVLAEAAHEVDALKALKAGAADYLLKAQLFPTLVWRTLRYAAESRRSARDLESSERYFRALIENASDMIFVLERGGTWRYLAPSARRLLGVDPEDLVGQRLEDFLHPEDVEIAGALLEQVSATPHVRLSAELRLHHHDGSWRSFEVTLENRLDDPVVAGLVGNASDTTQRRAAQAALDSSEEQLRQFQRIEAIGRLAGGVAHDFNNLLTAMSGHIYLLSAEMAPDDARRLHVEEIQRNAARAAALTRQLLAFSRKQVFRARVLDLNAVVAEVERMLRRLIGEDVELVTDLAPDLARVRADHSQIEQVIVNLAVNARDAMPTGGRLSIRTANAAIGPDHPRAYGYVPPGDYVLLSVADTGEGMDEAVRSRVFEPFFTTKEVGKGTGLGLSTVYGIVKQSGGFVWVDSAPGAGSVFEIYLPRIDASEEPEPQPDRAAHPLPTGRETILLVEDEEAVRALAHRVLRRNGYNVLVARDGSEAIDIAQQFEAPIHLVVSDVVMPRVGGREVADALGRREPRPRILLMSGYTPGEHPSADQLVADAYLQKPFTPDVLVRAVRSLLDQG